MVIIWNPADWSEVELLDYFVTVWALFSAMQVIMAIVKILATQLAASVSAACSFAQRLQPTALGFADD